MRLGRVGSVSRRQDGAAHGAAWHKPRCHSSGGLRQRTGCLWIERRDGRTALACAGGDRPEDVIRGQFGPARRPDAAYRAARTCSGRFVHYLKFGGASFMRLLLLVATASAPAREINKFAG